MGLASATVIAGVASLSRAFLSLGCNSFEVRGLDRFLRILHSPERRQSRTGLLTYANHVSVLDEPLLWGTLPFRGSVNPLRPAQTLPPPFYTSNPAENARWTLAASDIVYKNAAMAAFFNTGQVLETFRGASPFQPALDRALEILDKGRWVHVFPEGYVNLSRTTDLRRFKWGISRMAMEADRAPVCIPIWITGFDQVMPEPRSAPRWLPRLGASVTVTFGRPVSQAAMQRVFTADSRCIGAVPSKAEDDASTSLTEQDRRHREGHYWESAWQPNVETLGPPEDWETRSGYESLHSQSQSSSSATYAPPPPQNSHYPPLATHKPPPQGWPTNPPHSRAARALQLESTHPERASVRSAFAALLRAEMARLGMCVRREMGDGDGEGRLAHTIMQQS
ncbi:Lyso-phosphatidylcholine acyltransferase [Tilletia horrida]|uniref:Tafazzin family protein n=1 Tax=Tilletia horrida TaxID=155126 RepID=A0AAN6JWS2_9BASI|nr:Lyso-phosphatidylcholine acyltransferase [Tilletia horrida]